MSNTVGNIVVGNAPVSWGVYEAHLPNPPWQQIADAIASAGYAATELGPYGYLPVEKDALAAALKERKLALGSSFCSIALDDPLQRGPAVAHCTKVAALLATQGVKHLIVADDEDPARTKIAGRVPKDGSRSWTDAQWNVACATLDAIGATVRERYGMTVVVHHHAGTYIETRAEIDRAMSGTNADLVGLLIDTGHATYGGADACELLERHGKRVRYVHYKDISKSGLAQIRSTDISMQDAWKSGVFCTIGAGAVDFVRFTKTLRALDYAGFVIVEQDVVRNAKGELVPEPTEQARQSRAYLRETLGLT